jgi:hypothetical protein
MDIDTRTSESEDNLDIDTRTSESEEDIDTRISDSEEDIDTRTSESEENLDIDLRTFVLAESLRQKRTWKAECRRCSQSSAS